MQWVEILRRSGQTQRAFARAHGFGISASRPWIQEQAAGKDAPVRPLALKEIILQEARSWRTHRDARMAWERQSTSSVRRAATQRPICHHPRRPVSVLNLMARAWVGSSPQKSGWAIGTIGKNRPTFVDGMRWAILCRRRTSTSFGISGAAIPEDLFELFRSPKAHAGVPTERSPRLSHPTRVEPVPNVAISDLSTTATEYTCAHRAARIRYPG